MTTKAQQTGMQGVYLVAAELSRQGFIVAPTSRSARGADLLVTDQQCHRAYTVQVKTNSQHETFWLVGEHARHLKAASHLYVLVNLSAKGATEYFIIPSENLAALVREDNNKNSNWFYVTRESIFQYQGVWAPFGDPR